MVNRSATTTNRVRLKPLRIASLAVGGVLLLVSVVPWIVFLQLMAEGFAADDSGVGATNQDFVEAFFGTWLFLWLPGLVMVVAATVDWLRRTQWTVLGLAAVMVVVSGAAALIGLYQG